MSALLLIVCNAVFLNRWATELFDRGHQKNEIAYKIHLKANLISNKSIKKHPNKVISTQLKVQKDQKKFKKRMVGC